MLAKADKSVRADRNLSALTFLFHVEHLCHTLQFGPVSKPCNGQISKCYRSAIISLCYQLDIKLLSSCYHSRVLSECYHSATGLASIGLTELSREPMHGPVYPPKPPQCTRTHKYFVVRTYTNILWTHIQIDNCHKFFVR